MGFLVQIDPFTFPEERRYFVAERDGPASSRSSASFRSTRGAAGSSRTSCAIPTRRTARSSCSSMPGMRAAAAEDRSRSSRSAWCRSRARSARGCAPRAALGRSLYDFDGLRAFKAKFKPTGVGSDLPRVSDRAERVRRRRRHADRVRARRPAAVRARDVPARPGDRRARLAVLLVVWTVLLALPASAAYFPSPRMAVRLGRVRRRARRGSVRAGAPLATAAGRHRRHRGHSRCRGRTIVQAIAYDFPHRRGVLDIIVLVIAMLAPTIAAILLWNARAHRAMAEH